MRLGSSLRSVVLCLLAIGSWPAESSAQALARVKKPAAASDGELNAKRLYEEGRQLYDKYSDYEKAGARFEASNTASPRALTLYAMALCQRQLRRGHYVRALRLFGEALSTAEGARGLDEELRETARLHVRTIAQEHVVSVWMVIPPDVSIDTIAVNDSPLMLYGLESFPWTGDRRYLVGERAPGRGEAAPAARFIVVTEPGKMRIALTMDGRASLIRRSVDIKQNDTSVVLDPRLWPPSLRVDNIPPEAELRLSGPVRKTFPNRSAAPASKRFLDLKPGRYHLELSAPGYEGFSGDYQLDWGNDSYLRVDPEHYELVKQWWFWAVVAGVAGAGIVAAVSLANQPEHADGGTLGVVVRP